MLDLDRSPSTVMVSVVGQVLEVSDRIIYLESDVIWTLVFTGALASHPQHWDNLTEHGVIIIYPWAKIRTYTTLVLLYG